MAQHDELLEIERRGWEALATDGDSAARFYDEVLAREVLMLLPGGLVIDDRQQVVDSMRGAPWASFELADERVLTLDDVSAVVAYRGTAERSGQVYTALFASTYVREGDRWRLALHQQTPIT